MTSARNASPEEARQQSLALLNQHLAAAVILQDRMRRSPRNRMGTNFSLMETCTMLIAGRLNDLGGTVRWPVLLDDVVSKQNARRPSPASQPHNGLPDVEPLDAFGQSVLDAVTVAAAYGDTTTAAVMEQIWRGVDRQLWKVDVQQDIRQ